MKNFDSGFNAVIASGIAAAVLASGVALAEGAPATAPRIMLAQAEQGTKSSYLSIDTVVQQLEAQGYRVYGIELDDGRYEVEALDSAQNQVELKVDPESGEILYQERDD